MWLVVVMLAVFSVVALTVLLLERRDRRRAQRALENERRYAKGLRALVPKTWRDSGALTVVYEPGRGVRLAQGKDPQR